MHPRHHRLVVTCILALGTAALALTSTHRAGAQALSRAPVACAVGAPHSMPPAGDTPDRGAIVVSMRVVTDAVRSCLGGAHAALQTRFVFRGADGVATEVQIVEGGATPPSDAELRCIEAAACLAHVPPFSTPSFTVSFPFRF